REGLEPLQDGYAALTGTVADLLDAGLGSSQAAALEDALRAGAQRASREARAEGVLARGRALVRVAARSADAFARLGLGRASTRLALAREMLEQDPERALPSRAVLVHGFA